MLIRFRKISPFLYRSGAPTPEDVIWLKDNFKISRIISLDEKTGNKIKLACKLLKIKQIPLYIDNTRESLIRFLSQIDKLFESSEKTLLHCLHGKDRTGLAAALYRCNKQGWSTEDAIKEAKSLDFGGGLAPEVVKLYESFIRNAGESKDINFVSDIVDESREEMYNNWAISPSENISWSPYNDHPVREWQTSFPMERDEHEQNLIGGFGPSLVGNGLVL